MKPTIIGAVVYSERKFPTLFPEDHNNSQCFVFTKMSGSGFCRIHAQRYEETGKKQKEMGFIFIFILKYNKYLTFLYSFLIFLR